MGYYGFSWAPYVSVEEKKAKAQKSLEKLRKKNPDISPVVIAGKSLVKTWWGKSWNQNLVKYSDYSNRIGRGRSYVRNGAVLDLKIYSSKVEAIVQGSSAKPYTVDIHIQPLSDKNWRSITVACEGRFGSLQELVEGKFPKELTELFNAKGDGLFPTSSEIRFNCSCPDGASMCKHVAAVLFGIGSRLDIDPKLFFVLRNVNVDELISKTVLDKSAKLIEKSKKRSGRVIEANDISDMFGIDLAEGFGDEAVVLADKSPKNKAKKEKITKNPKNGSKAKLNLAPKPASKKNIQIDKVDKSKLSEAIDSKKKSKPPVENKTAVMNKTDTKKNSTVVTKTAIRKNNK